MDGTDHNALNEKPTYFDIEIELRYVKRFHPSYSNSLAKHVNYL